MGDAKKDTGILMALVERVKEHRLPNAFALKAKVDRGDRLSDYDVELLEKIISDLKKVEPLLARHPEHQTLYDRLAHLYKEITDIALENERRLG